MEKSSEGMTHENLVIPFYQSLLQNLQSLRNGDISQEDFLAFLSELETTVQNARSEVESQAHPDLEDEVAFLESAFSLFIQGAKGVSRGIREEDEPLVEESVPKIKSGFEEMRTGLARFGLRKASIAPSKSPAFNILWNAYQGLVGGACSKEVFEVFLRLFESYLQDTDRRIRRMKRIGPEFPEEFLPQLETQQAGTMESQHLFLMMQDAFRRGDYPGMEGDLRQMERFAVSFVDFADAVSQKVMQAMERVCPRCGQKNLSGNASCFNCKFSFPPSPFSSSGIDIQEVELFGKNFVMTANIQKILDAVEDFQDGLLDPGGFQGVLDWMEGKLKRGGEEYRKTRLYQEEKKKTPELIGAYDSGIQEMHEGVRKLRLWVDSGLQADCADGVRVLLRGAARLHEVISSRSSSSGTERS